MSKKEKSISLSFAVFSLLFILLNGFLGNEQNGVTTAKKAQVVTKKGFDVVAGKNNNWLEKLEKLNVGWNYTWGSNLPENQPKGVEFVPMIWGRSNIDKKIQAVKELARKGKVKYLLGFNEPDGKKQANLTVEEALRYWPKLESVGLPLGSPACVHADNEWMKKFMDKASEKGYRIDFICVHWYGGTNPQSLISYLKKIHDLYHRPIWLTEFAPADWHATSPEDSKVTKEKALAFIRQILPALDSIPYVARYSWFSARPSSASLGNSALFDSEGKLTPIGKYYANFK